MKRTNDWTWPSLTLALILFVPALGLELVLCPLAWTVGFAARVGVAIGVDVAEAFRKGWKASNR